jgi:hydrogenase-4 component B
MIHFLPFLLATIFLLPFIPKKSQFWVSMVLFLLLAFFSIPFSIDVFITGSPVSAELTLPFINPILLVADKLSAFFVLVIIFTVFTGLLFGKGYLNPYMNKKSQAEIGLHYLSYLWLSVSMVMVCLVRDGFAFLAFWEIMSVSSFILVIFEHDKPGVIQTGIKYLIQMHVGFILILLGFFLAAKITGQPIGFEALENYFGLYIPLPLFLLFFVGFGIKAGFIPLHTWLPHAHPAAPSHVSGVMSGVMIKMGIYGILRVLTYIHTDLYLIGMFILAISIVSGLIGVTLAIAQHDLKKLLAYHSIENIGIIGIGIGVGTIGLAKGLDTLAVLGFSGAILHVLNHSLFKSLLFYSAGSIYSQSHTLFIEHLGGLVKRMPKTAFFFLIGALAICGLPPFNGFVSEFLIFTGLFSSLHQAGFWEILLIMSGVMGLVIIGGLAVFCFTKVFSIVFLGNPRSGVVEKCHEVQNGMLFPKFLITLAIVAIGLLPFVFVPFIQDVVYDFLPVKKIDFELMPILQNISIAAIAFILLVILIWLVKSWQQKKVQVSVGETWGCGYTGANPAVHQYTATSFADNINQLAKITNVKKQYQPYGKTEVFPEIRSFETHSSDIFENNLVQKPTSWLNHFLDRIAVFQSGDLRLYLLYAIVFILVIFGLTLFKVI